MRGPGTTTVGPFGKALGAGKRPSVEVDVPDDFAAALDSAPGTRSFFDSLSNSLQRYHVDNINAAKAPDTRARRIRRSVELFAAGKKR